MLVQSVNRITKYLVGPGIDSDEISYGPGKARVQISPTASHGLALEFHQGMYPEAVVNITGEEADQTLWYVVDAALRGKSVSRKTVYTPLIPVPKDEQNPFTGTHVEGPLTGSELSFSGMQLSSGDISIHVTLRLRDKRPMRGVYTDLCVTIPNNVLDVLLSLGWKPQTVDACAALP